MSEARERLRRICIAGSGQVAVIAALALRRALPDCHVVVVGTPADPGAFADQATTALPFSNKLHDRLGLAEQQIVARAGGSHRLVQRYLGWAGPGSAGAMPYGAEMDLHWRTRFAREWGGGPRNATEGSRPAGSLAGSLAEVLADAGRFAVPPGDAPSPLDDIDYALRWNMPAYRDLLIAAAQQVQVAYVPGVIDAVEPDGAGGIAAVSVEGQGQIAADLFLDCTGPAATLASSLAQSEWQDWSPMLPVRRLFVARPGLPQLALADTVRLLPEGWLAEVAGRDGTYRVLGLADGIGEQAALTALGAPPDMLLELDPGCRREAWLGNVIALGDAAAWFEPLGHLNLDLAHRQLALLLEMLPGRPVEPLERGEYNRRAALMAAQVRDTLALHYAAPAAATVFGARALPESLAHLLDQFTRRGRLPFREEAPLLGQEQAALLAALGYVAGTTPQASGEAPELAGAALATFDRRARAALAFAPPYAEFIARSLGAPANPVAADLQY